MSTTAHPFQIVIDAIPTVGKLGINGTSDPTNPSPLLIDTDGFICTEDKTIYDEDRELV